MCLVRDYYPGDPEEVNALAVQAVAQYAHFSDDRPALREKSALAEFSGLFVAERDGRLLGAVVYLRPGAAKADIFRSEWALMQGVLRLYRRRGFQWSHEAPSLHGVAYDLHTRSLHEAHADASAVSRLRSGEAPGSRT